MTTETADNVSIAAGESHPSLLPTLMLSIKRTIAGISRMAPRKSIREDGLRNSQALAWEAEGSSRFLWWSADKLELGLRLFFHL